MVSLFERLFGRSSQADKSGKQAKDRLQFVLVQDRINLPAEKMQQMQQEILDVISKYVAVDIENVDFELSNRERNGVLIAEIPFGVAINTDNPPDILMSEEADLPADDDDEPPDVPTSEDAEHPEDDDQLPDTSPDSFSEETRPAATPSDEDLKD